MSREFKFDWLDLVMQADHASLGKYKALAYAIVIRHMFKSAVDAYPGLPTLAEETGMSPRTVSTGVDVLFEAGWIGKKSGGGKKVSNTYWLTIPCSMLQGLQVDTLQKYAQYLAKVRAIPCKSEADTLQLVARETELNLVLNQIEPDESEYVAHGEPTEPQIDIHLEKEKESQRSIAIALPEPKPHQKALWSDQWPDDGEFVRSYSSSEKLKDMVGVEAAKLLGSTFDRPLKVGRVFLDRHINLVLGDDVCAALAAEMRLGRLRKTTLAEVLAAHDFVPLDPAQKEVSHASL